MTHDLNASQARTVSTTDLIVYNEIDYINRQIIAASLAGDLSVTVDDGTTMTESTPTITVIGTIANPTITPANTLIIDSQTITLSQRTGSGTNIDNIVGDINTLSTGLVASENTSNQLVVTYEPAQGNWALVIGAGTANAEVGFTAGTVVPTDPESVNYYSVWSGTTDDRKLKLRNVTGY